MTRPLLDELDRRLVGALHVAPRATWDDIGGILAADASTLKRRYDRLHKARMVRAIGHAYWGMHSTAMPVHVFLDITGETPLTVLHRLRDLPHLQLLAQVSGHDPLYAVIHAPSEAATSEAIDRLYSVPGVRRVNALPALSTTAFLVLDRVARVEPGERVLLHAAAGGVGSQLGQAARLLGAERVVGTVGSAAKVETAKRFGYDEVITRDRIADAGEFDVVVVVVDVVGGPARRASLDRLAPMGRLVVMGNASGAEDVGIPANELWFTNKTVSGFNLAAFSAAFPEETRQALRRAVAAAAAGDLRVEVETLPLEQAVGAHRRIESGTTTGKLVLEVAEE
ncbi:zinc-binding dehydrogenase [Streptomyces cucumeris]|uniref:zinc-binding dehydrogenase n=1 Tax=Streptomyces cucumeris TaxID=2962890 RepID=UPI003D703B96